LNGALVADVIFPDKIGYFTVILGEVLPNPERARYSLLGFLFGLLIGG